MAKIDLNSVNLSGRLTATPELKTGNTGTSYVRFSLAVNSVANQQSRVDYIYCTAFGNTAEAICKWLGQGSQVIVTGSIQNNNYTDQNGITHYNMQLIVHSIHFMDSKAENAAAQERSNPVVSSNTRYANYTNANAQKTQSLDEIVERGDRYVFSDDSSDFESLL